MPSTWIMCHMHDGDHAEAQIETGSVNLKQKGEEFPIVSLFLGDLTRARLVAAAINGELETALRRFVAEYDEMTCDLEGQNPLIDSGCIDCTVGTVPNDKNTGRCLYHLAESLGIKPPSADGPPRFLKPQPSPRETPEPCTDEAFAAGCFCYVPAPGPTDIDPPEPKRHPECPLHGWRDPDAELERKRDKALTGSPDAWGG